MMRILVTGGTGVLGRETVAAVESAGHTVRVGSRGPRRAGTPDVREWAVMDLAAGSGIDEAVAEVDVVIHAASDPKRSQAADVEGTRALVDACRRRGVGHLVYVSIVGIDRIPVPYYRHKLAAEGIVTAGGVPFSILRATQFHPFIDQLLASAARVPLVMPLPIGFQVQSVDVAEVARRLLRCAEAGPGGRLPDFGGPEAMSFREAARAWRAARGVRKPVLPLPLPGRAAAALRAGANTVPVGEHGTVRWRDWLRGQPSR
ncbi:MAG TPA: NAD(P)H-binding protein [Longimicrobium sp.]|nr:NAD(P)H-binding protein [Longimicrobium sp.]